MRAAITTTWLGTGTEADPYRPQMLPVNNWQDATGQPIPDIAEAKNRYTIEADLTAAQLAAIQADSRFIVLWSREDDAPAIDLTAPQVDALKTKLSAVYNPDVVRLATDGKVKPVEIANALIAAQVRPPWKAGITATVGQVYAYDANLYEVIQSHATQTSGSRGSQAGPISSHRLRQVPGPTRLLMRLVRW